MGKRILISICVFPLIMLFLAGCEQEMNFGVVDIQAVIDQAPLAREYQESLDRKGRELEEQFQDEAQDMSEEERMARQQDAYQEYLALKEIMEQELDDMISQAVEAVAEEQKINVILYKQAVRYGGKDITQDVIAELSDDRED